MRESKIKYLKFEYCNYEGTVYDFKINGYKIQEKVGSIMKQNGSFGFNLNKNGGRKDGNANHIPY